MFRKLFERARAAGLFLALQPESTHRLGLTPGSQCNWSIASASGSSQNFSLRFTRLLIRLITDSTALAEPSRTAFVESKLLVSWLSYG